MIFQPRPLFEGAFCDVEATAGARTAWSEFLLPRVERGCSCLRWGVWAGSSLVPSDNA